MTVRIRIRTSEEQQQQPPAKHQWTEEEGDAGAADRYTKISAHAVVLCAQSAYFDKCLGGDWAESEERVVKLTVENDQELEDLRLLIMLSYSDSYIHGDDGALLPLDTRVRLGVLADAHEFVGALGQVVESMP
jgi:hypothetical protein